MTSFLIYTRYDLLFEQSYKGRWDYSSKYHTRRKESM